MATTKNILVFVVIYCDALESSVKLFGMRTSSFASVLWYLSQAAAYRWERYCFVSFHGESLCAVDSEVGRPMQVPVGYASLCPRQVDTKCGEDKSIECCVGVEELPSTSYDLELPPSNATHVHFLCRERTKQ